MATKIFLKVAIFIHLNAIVLCNIDWNCENMSPSSKELDFTGPEAVRMPFILSTNKNKYGLREEISGIRRLQAFEHALSYLFVFKYEKNISSRSFFVFQS